MFGKLKQWGMKKAIESQLKNIPEKYRNMILEFVENNPELCEKLALELQGVEKLSQAEQQKKGLAILQKHQQEIAAALTPEMQEALAGFMGGGMMGKFNPNGSIRQ